MGGCCSCLKDGRHVGGGRNSNAETEMSDRGASTSVSGSKQLCICRPMTAPTIEIERGATKVSGYGLALAGAGIEQDAAYWEWHILKVPPGSVRPKIKFGVATKKDRKFYIALQESGDDAESPEHNGTALMRTVEVTKDDVIGVAVQQSDLPMIQFLLNGELLHHQAINRFRGLVFPAVYLPENDGDVQVELVMNESGFKEMSPNARFGPVIVARGLI